MSITKLLSSRAPATPNTGKASPPYEVRDIPGKGKWLVATRKITRGQVFMVDYSWSTAAVVADAQFPSRVKRAQGRQLLKEAIKRLPAADTMLTLARSSPDAADVPAAEDVMKTNSFSVDIDGKGYMALFPGISRINHTCKPSALTRFNATTLSNAVTAFHDILPGEEITISFPKTPARLYEQVVDAVREEGMMSHMGEHYEALARLCAAAGDARKTAERVRRAISEGERI
ncbi:hypothetical protein VTK56DRAFT_8901 [Thermocarpiscus australiensis]